MGNEFTILTFQWHLRMLLNNNIGDDYDPVNNAIIDNNNFPGSDDDNPNNNFS